MLLMFFAYLIGLKIGTKIARMQMKFYVIRLINQQRQQYFDCVKPLRTKKKANLVHQRQFINVNQYIILARIFVVVFPLVVFNRKYFIQEFNWILLKRMIFEQQKKIIQIDSLCKWMNELRKKMSEQVCVCKKKNKQ